MHVASDDERRRPAGGLGLTGFAPLIHRVP
jgi:hypothetical protein